MSRSDAFRVGSGWGFPVDPQSVVENTMAGGYTVDLKTGQVPTTGTMVSIPGHEKAVPVEQLNKQSVIEYGETPENKALLKSPEMFLGTWRSDEDKSVGDAGYLDVSKNYPDTPEGSKAARRAAMEGSQWGLWNIDRGVTESNISHPGVRENIKESQKIEIPESEVQDYLESDQPVGRHLPLGFRTESDVIRTRSGRKKTVAGPGQMTWAEIASKPNYD
jgi:hypothetical protein